jgi:serine/threonine protein phosphatase PrpC
MSLETFKLSVPASGKGEDCVDILRLDCGVAMVVADGVGGRPGGAEAAALLVENVVDYFIGADYVLSDRALANLLSEIDQALSTDEIAGETTAIVAVVTDEEIVGAYAGDSDAYLILPGVEYKLTHGRRKPYLGYGSAWPEPFTAELRDGTLLLASDGLWKYADLDRICAIVRSPDLPLSEIAELLIEATRLPNGTLWDDISVALCRERRQIEI